MAIVGWPVAESLSPTLWRGMASRRGLALAYEPRPVAPDDAGAWEDLWRSDLDAFNITAPYKARAAAECTRVSPDGADLASVNTAIREDDGWMGHTTDGYGFKRSVEAMGVELKGTSVFVLGAGGAGRAVARAAAEESADVVLVTRSPDDSPTGCRGCSVAGWEALSDRAAPAIVVNATPLGKTPEDPPVPAPIAAWGRDTLAIDLNYSPPRTSFLEAAAEAGCRVANGVGLLVHQACLSAALVIDGDPALAAAYEEDFMAAVPDGRLVADRC